MKLLTVKDHLMKLLKEERSFNFTTVTNNKLISDNLQSRLHILIFINYDEICIQIFKFRGFML